jgi:regulator of protease activity HflC (stomatin/prohibitin superfamily)
MAMFNEMSEELLDALEGKTGKALHDASKLLQQSLRRLLGPGHDDTSLIVDVDDLKAVQVPDSLTEGGDIDEYRRALAKHTKAKEALEKRLKKSEAQRDKQVLEAQYNAGKLKVD